MIVGDTLRKEPAEILDWPVDLKDALAGGMTIAGAPVFRAVCLNDGTDATSALQHSLPSLLGTLVIQLVKAGVAGQSYMLELTLTDSLGRVFEVERCLVVKDIP